jgi:hypothetical protein
LTRKAPYERPKKRIHEEGYERSRYDGSGKVHQLSYRAHASGEGVRSLGLSLSASMGQEITYNTPWRHEMKRRSLPWGSSSNKYKRN